MYSNIVIFQHQNGPIHYAVTHCTLPPVRTLVSLISAGADVNLVDAVRLFINNVIRKQVFGLLNYVRTSQNEQKLESIIIINVSEIMF